MEYAKRLAPLNVIVSSRCGLVQKRNAALSTCLSPRPLATLQILGLRRPMVYNTQGYPTIMTSHENRSLHSHRFVIPRSYSALTGNRPDRYGDVDFINQETLSASFFTRRNSRYTSSTPSPCGPHELHMNARYSISTQQPTEESFRIIRIAVDTGDLELVSFTPTEILARTNLLPRDLVGLALSSRRERRHHTAGNTLVENMRHPPAILPRKDCILISFGPIRAVAERDFVYIFDVHNQGAESFAGEVSRLYKYRAASIDQQQQRQQQEQEQQNAQSSNKEQLTPPSRKIEKSFAYFNQIPNVHEEHPELIFLETVLADSADSFSRRIRIFEPIVNELLLRVSTDEEFSGSGIHQLAPLKEQLQSLEVFVTQAYQCLTQLLNDDEEMLKLLLTEQAEARRTDIPVAFERHQHVELLLGVYSRQFSSHMLEVNYLLSRIESKQQFLELELALYRNRLIRMNVDLGILAAATGITTAVSGAFGMNLISGFEDSAVAFMMVSAGSAMGALGVANYFRSRMSGKAIQRRAEQRIEEIQTLSRAMSDMAALEYTVKKMMKGRRRMSRDEFKEELNMARRAQACSDKEIDVLFNILDTHKDDFLDFDDFPDDDAASDDDGFAVLPSIRASNSTKHA